MQNVEKLNPPIQYNLIWLIIGLALLIAVLSWYGIVIWLTRRKKLKSIDNLKQLPSPVDLDALKAKYLQFIEDLYLGYQRKEITLRELHQRFSLATRYFVYEAIGFPAPLLTLSDLKLAPYPKLTKLIEDYYPEEFAAINKGKAFASKEAAIGFITQWPF
jgi:hypothetical protein